MERTALSDEPFTLWPIDGPGFPTAGPVSIGDLKWSQQPVRYQAPNGFNGWNELSVANSKCGGRLGLHRAKPVTDLHWWDLF